VKAFNFRGLSPDPHQVLCSWTLLVALPPDPHYRLDIRADMKTAV